jgi:hypothetical protein
MKDSWTVQGGFFDGKFDNEEDAVAYFMKVKETASPLETVVLIHHRVLMTSK